MRRRRSSAYLDPYRRAVKVFGPSFEATLWASRDAQLLRFDVMASMIDLEGRRIVDAGCGRGDLAARLLERDVRFADYVGIDAMAPMIDSARDRRLDGDGGRVRFEVVDLVDDPGAFARLAPDVVCISGTLNTMDDGEARGLVEAAFAAANAGVVFNFLSDRCAERWRDRDLTPARRFDTVAWLDWALGLTPRVAFRQDYLDGHDATIAIVRE
jgi:SAM-dependent methyltransferase